MALSPTETRDVLARLGHAPKRFLGQNFLVDGNIVRKSLELARVGAGDRVVEVGPGLGTLTGALLGAGAEVWAIERDPTLHAYLEAELAPRHPSALHLELGDAVDRPRAALPPDGGDFKIVANLPYAISTPWMDAVLSGPLPSRMVLMLQKEAADRYVSAPGGRTFGAISIFLQAAYDAEPGHRVSAACFHPRPDVDSVLLNLSRKASPFVFSAPVRALIRRCFQQRRKQLGAVLREAAGQSAPAWLELLAAEALSPMVRAEAVPVAAWMRLSRAGAPPA